MFLDNGPDLDIEAIYLAAGVLNLDNDVSGIWRQIDTLSVRRSSAAGQVKGESSKQKKSGQPRAYLRFYT